MADAATWKKHVAALWMTLTHRASEQKSVGSNVPLVAEEVSAFAEVASSVVARLEAQCRISAGQCQLIPVRPLVVAGAV